MTQLDSSIPLQVRTPNLADLADTYFGAKKFKEDMLNSQQDRLLQAKDNMYKAKADERADKAETRAQGEYDQALTDLATKRQNALHDKLNSYLGEEAETLDNLEPEKRPIYYKNYLIPNLQKAGFDISDMPEYNDKLIEGWRKRAMTPGERAIERNTKAKASGSDLYDLKIDKDGNYVYIPKNPVVMTPGQNPNTIGPNGVINSGVSAPPQVGVVQGPNGPMGYSFPRGNGPPTAVPITNPNAGGKEVERPKIPIPPTVQSAVRNNRFNANIVGNILTELAKPGNNPTGPDKDLISKLPYGSNINAWLDPNGEPTRELIGKLSSLKMKDISGAVINAHEMPRLAQWIPQIKDTKEVVKVKLKHFLDEVNFMNNEIASQYSSAQGYRTNTPTPNVPVISKPATPYKASGKTSDGKDFTIEEVP